MPNPHLPFHPCIPRRQAESFPNRESLTTLVRNSLQSVSTFATLLAWGFVPTRHHVGAPSFPFFWERVGPSSVRCHSLPLFEQPVRTDCSLTQETNRETSTAISPFFGGYMPDPAARYSHPIFHPFSSNRRTACPNNRKLDSFQSFAELLIVLLLAV